MTVIANNNTLVDLADDQSKPTAAAKIVKPKPGLILKLDGGAAELNEDLAQKAFGTDDNGFILGALQQVIALTVKNGEIDRQQLDFIGGALVGINPQNALEAMMAVQIVANHVMTMKIAGLFCSAMDQARREALEKMYTKLARTSPAQFEALHRMRHGGQQQMVVRHINVGEGGQAVFGNINSKQPGA
jgi:hypothetical protein